MKSKGKKGKKRRKKSKNTFITSFFSKEQGKNKKIMKRDMESIPKKKKSSKRVVINIDDTTL